MAMTFRIWVAALNSLNFTFTPVAVHLAFDRCLTRAVYGERIEWK